MKTSLCLFTVVASLLSDSPPEKHPSEVEYRIPKGYTGFLFLAFNMPGGVIPDREYDWGNVKSQWPKRITLDFDDQGVAQYGYESLPNSVTEERIIERESGTRVPLVARKQQLGDKLPARAVLRDGGRGVLRKNRKEFTVEVLLVGDPAKFPDTLIGYESEEIDKLLLKHFGLPLPEKQDPKPGK